MISFLTVRLIDGLRKVPGEPDEVVLALRESSIRPPAVLREATPGLQDALGRLRDGGVTKALLHAGILARDGPVGLRRLKGWLVQLDELGMIERMLVVEGIPQATLRPLAPALEPWVPRAGGPVPFVLSRFAFCRNDRGRLILETPCGHSELQVHAEPVMAALLRLVRPATGAMLAEDVIGLDAGAATLLLELLDRARALVPSPAHEVAPEDADPVLGRWAFHDLVFHSRHRLGRHADPYGAYPLADRFEPLPVLKPPMSVDSVSLPRPDIEGLCLADAPFTGVLESRASLRRHGARPLGLRELGEFLFRCARLKELGAGGDASRRPYPSGGALHALEIYPVVARCEDLAGGLYHYDPGEHLLHKVDAPEGMMDALVEEARSSAGMDEVPQVLFVIAARFQRVQQNYQSLAYSLILKDAGCLMQTMYLVATAMGLAPCALGGGHSDLFARAAGLDYFAETSVAEFILGSRPD